MMCYKDKTWCTYGKECVYSKNCGRDFNEEERLKAIKWWGNENVPVCFFSDKPKCYNNGTTDNNNNKGTP